MKGLLIYKEEDYIKNTAYADMLIQYGQLDGLEIECVLFEHIRFGVNEQGLFVEINHKPLQNIHFVINRTRETMLAQQFEGMGIRVFNVSKVTYLANHKGRTHQFVSRLGIPSLRSFMYYPDFMKVEDLDWSRPFVIKGPEGHGGTEVFKVDNKETLHQLLKTYEKKEWLVQDLCNHVGEDVRVFVMGNKIIGAIRRFSNVDFRANYCLGGQIESYTLNKEEEAWVNHLLSHLKCDYVGIDFMKDKDGRFIFNELEDVVGSRSLYTLNQLDTARLYSQYIASTLKHTN